MADEGGVQLAERLAFVADGAAQLFGHDAGQVVGGQVLRPEDRDAVGAGPRAVQQQAGGGGRDVGDSDEGGLAVGVDGVGEDALLADRVGLLQEVLEEGRVGQGPVGDAGVGDEVVHGEGGGDEAARSASGVPRPSAETPTTWPTSWEASALTAGRVKPL